MITDIIFHCLMFIELILFIILFVKLFELGKVQDKKAKKKIKQAVVELIEWVSDDEKEKIKNRNLFKKILKKYEK